MRAEENLEAVPVAVVTKEPRLVLNWRGKSIVNLSRAFLDTNGAHQETDVFVDVPSKEDNYFEQYAVPAVKEAVKAGDLKKAWKALLRIKCSAPEQGSLWNSSTPPSAQAAC